MLIDDAGTIADPNLLLGNTVQSNINNGVEVRDGAVGDLVGGSSSGTGNLLTHNGADGVVFSGSTTTANQVLGNDASFDGANGVEVNREAAGNIIGGVAVGAGNTFANNHNDGVLLAGNGTTTNQILDNNISLNGANGVEINTGASNNTIGGLYQADGNTIEDNFSGDGVLVTGNSTGNAILSNVIFDNAFPIDLGGNGFVPNDSAGHSGPNNFQDFPILTAAVLDASGNTTIQGTLFGTALAPYTVQLFDYPKLRTVGRFGFLSPPLLLATLTVVPDATGQADFRYVSSASALIIPGLEAGDSITATADDELGNTSELSPELLVTSPLNYLAASNPSVTNYTLEQSGSNLQVVDTTNPTNVLASQPLATTSSIAITGNPGGSDTLTTDCTGGYFSIPCGISFTGSGNGALNVQGGSFAGFTDNLTGPGPGTSLSTPPAAAPIRPLPTAAWRRSTSPPQSPASPSTCPPTPRAFSRPTRASPASTRSSAPTTASRVPPSATPALR